MSFASLQCPKWPTRFLPLRGVLVFVGAILALMCVGSFHNFGNMAPYIVSYIQERSHPTNLKDEYVALIYASNFIGEGGGNIIGGWLVKKIGPRWTSIISGIIVCLSVSLSYFTIKVSFWLLILTYGFLLGFGGVGYVGPISTVMKWTPNWKGLASAITMMGFGSSPFFSGGIQILYINPHNVSPVPSGSRYRKFTDPDLLHRVPISFLFLGSLYAVTMFIGSLLIIDPPEDNNYSGQTVERVIPSEVTKYLEVDDIDEINMKKLSVLTKHVTSCCDKELSSPKGDDDKTELLGSDAHTSRAKSSGMKTSPPTSYDVISLSTRQVLKVPNFYIKWAIYFFALAAQFIIISTNKIFSEDFIDDDHFLTLVGSISFIFSIFGSFFGVLIASYISYTLTFIISSGILTVFLLTFYACTVGGKVMFLIWMCVIFFNSGGIFSVLPVVMEHIYGLQHLPTNFGVLSSSKLLVGPFAFFFVLILSDHYFYIYMLASALTGLSFILSIIYRPKLYVAVR